MKIKQIKHKYYTNELVIMLLIVFIQSNSIYTVCIIQFDICILYKFKCVNIPLQWT